MMKQSQTASGESTEENPQLKITIVVHWFDGLKQRVSVD